MKDKNNNQEREEEALFSEQAEQIEKNESSEFENEGNQETVQLKEQVETLRRELEDEKQRHLRTRADLDNLRKRMHRETETKSVNAKKDILLDLLTFLDFFEQARKQVQDPAAAEGIDIIARQFHELLNRHGVKPIDCLGKEFDPADQEGIGYIETEEYPEGCVAEEICPGYKLGDILLKPARVMVARNPDDTQETKKEDEK